MRLAQAPVNIHHSGMVVYPCRNMPIMHPALPGIPILIKKMEDTYQEQSRESLESAKKLENSGKWQFNLLNPVITFIDTRIC